MAHRKMKPRCIASGITLGLYVQSKEKKVDLQFAMEAAKFEPLTFEEYLAVILLHMFLCGSKDNFMMRYANYILI